MLGHARRGGADGAPPTITRELQALMADLRLEDPAGIEQVGGRAGGLPFICVARAAMLRVLWSLPTYSVADASS